MFPPKISIAYILFFFFSAAQADEIEVGIASYYADKFHGKPTASGEPYDKDAYTAAHRTLPFGTEVEVTRIDDTGAHVVVKINDRGPHINGRIIDLSRQAAEAIDLIQAGLAEVTVEVVQPIVLDESIATD